MKSSRKELTIKEIDEILKNYNSVLSSEDILKLSILRNKKAMLKKHIIYETFKVVLAFIILIGQFFIILLNGWYILFFILLTLILTDAFFGEKIKSYFSRKIQNHILKKYNLK